MSNSLRIVAHIDLIDKLGERDDEGRHVSPGFVPNVRVLNSDTNVSTIFRNIHQVDCLLADIRIPHDGSRDWVYRVMDLCPCITRETLCCDEVHRLYKLAKDVADGRITTLHDFCVAMEGHPAVDCEEDEEGQLFADVLRTCRELLEDWDRSMMLMTDLFTVETW